MLFLYSRMHKTPKYARVGNNEASRYRPWLECEVVRLVRDYFRIFMQKFDNIVVFVENAVRCCSRADYPQSNRWPFGHVLRYRVVIIMQKKCGVFRG